MAQFRTTERMFIAGRVVAAGEIVEYAGEPGAALAPLDDDAVTAKVAAVQRWQALAGTIAGATPGTIAPRNPSRHRDVLRVARSLGAPAGVSVADAEDFIAAWLASPAVVGAIAEPASVSMPSNYKGPPGFQPPSEKWP
jgi:hypothetical protein